MKISKLITALLLFAVCTNVLAQGKYDYLRSWDGKYPTYNKSPQKFFNLPEVERPLKKLLNRRDYFILTKGHTREGLIKVIGNYLKVQVCGSPGSYACDNHAMFVIDLNDGSVYVAFDIFSGAPRYFSTKGKFTDLPENVRNWFALKART